MKRNSLTLALSLIAAMASAAVVSAGTVSGTATYRERIALRPDTVLIVQLLDISLADAPAKVLATKEYTVDVVPAAFSLEYDDSEIDQRFMYSISAEMRNKGQLIFRNTTVAPVITRGAPNQVDLVLEMMPRSKPKLENTSWEVRSIDGKEIAADVKPTIHFKDDNTVAIDSTCNTLFGMADIKGNTLNFPENMAGTLRACMEPNSTLEAEIKAVLGSITGFSFVSSGLNFLNDNGEVVFETISIPQPEQ